MTTSFGITEFFTHERAVEDRSYVTVVSYHPVPTESIFDITVSFHVMNTLWSFFFHVPPTIYFTKDHKSSVKHFSNPSTVRKFWGGINPADATRANYHWDSVALPGPGIWHLHIEFHADHRRVRDMPRDKKARYYTMSQSMNSDRNLASESLQLPAGYLGNPCTRWVLVARQRETEIEAR